MEKIKNNRFKLGLIFNFESSWMGGIVYIINLVKTLNFLDDEEKPEILLFYRSDLKRFLKEFDYPYLKAVEWNFPSFTSGYLKSIVLRKNLFIKPILKQFALDAVYPLQDYPVKTRTNTNLISWCTDFQYKHFPHFFSGSQNFARDLRTRLALKNNGNMVLSSHDAHKDLNKFFTVKESVKVHIYHFVSIIDDFAETDIRGLKKKYGLPDKYFMVSNQFHKHKNHKLVLEALAYLKESGIIIHVAFTGKLPDAGDSPYMAELHHIIDSNHLGDQISMLGVISRNDQLQLMKHSQAVIQPSLFEGWSTVIEDARSLQVPVIAASLGVNVEQLGIDHGYFDPRKVDDLVVILRNYPERDLQKTHYEKYSIRVKNAAKNLLQIMKNKN